MTAYTIKQRKEILADAAKYGMDQASKMHHVHYTTVYGWSKQMKAGVYDSLPDDATMVPDGSGPKGKKIKKAAKSVLPSESYSDLKNRIRELELSNKKLRKLLSEAHNAI